MIKEKYFIFVDETGNNDQEQFFGIGLIIVPSTAIGRLYNILDRNYQNIKNLSNLKMQERVKSHYIQGEYEDILAYAQSTNIFELKFKNINIENYSLYIQTMRECFLLPDLYFSCIFFDKSDDGYTKEGISHWDRYLNNLAMLIVNNMKNFSDDAEFVVLADQMTQPKTEKITYEESLCTKIQKRIEDKKIPQRLFGVTRIESHSAPMVQLVDILLGGVGYDFYGIERKRKESFVAEIRKLFAVKTLGSNMKKNKPIYFSVWKYQQK